MTPLLLGDLGTPELVVILVVVMLVFGGQKLPELARGSGRALRIFKAEISADDEPEGEASKAATPDAPSSDLETRQAAERRELERRHESERRALHEDDDGGSTPGR